MAKIKIESGSDPFTWYMLSWWHMPEYYWPNWPLGHAFSIWNLDNEDAGFGHTLTFPTLAEAQGMAVFLLTRPDICCDCCYDCHPNRGVPPPPFGNTPQMPRMNKRFFGYPYRRPNYISGYSPFPIPNPGGYLVYHA